MLRINLGLIEWAGGVAFGSGAVIGGQPLEKMGVMTKYPRQALDMAAQVSGDRRLRRELSRTVCTTWEVIYSRIIIGNSTWEG
jgi:hypothetical protein